MDDGKIRPAAEVRRAYKETRPLEREVLRLAALAQADYPRRIVSWTLDVLNVVRALVGEREGRRAEATPLHRTFTLEEVYAHAEELGKRHPSNRNIEPKIRQQLQVLRDMGLLTFLGSGEYRLT